MTIAPYEPSQIHVSDSSAIPKPRSLFPLNRRAFLPVRWDGLSISIVIAVISIGWAAVNLLRGWSGFAVVVPDGFRGGSEAAISLARLFAALVLVLVASGDIGKRLHWVASGFLVLGMGQLVFGYVQPMITPTTDTNTAIYQMVFVRSLAAALFIVGLLPATAPRFGAWTLGRIGVASLACVSGFWLFDRLGVMPALIRTDDMATATHLQIAPLSWLTPWHWVLAVPPFALALIAALGAIKRHRQGEIAMWLPLAIVLLAASELHDSFWPSAYGTSMIVNTADILRLAMAGLVAVGGAFALKSIAMERNALLIVERDRSRRFEELHALKSDFTAMVAHEIGQPLSAIRRQAEMLSLGDLDPETGRQAAASIIRETDVLDARAADMLATSPAAENEFGAELGPVRIGGILEEATAIVRAHSPDRILNITLNGANRNDLVLADHDRIGQVLRNLLGNAAKFSPPPTRISLRVLAPAADRRRIEVADAGPGIDPADRARIFEKYGRGSNPASRGTEGTGLGLYLSRCIVQSHGSDLTVRSTPNVGSVFTFDLNLVAGSSA